MELIKASAALFLLLNLFLISIYRIALIRDLSFKEVTSVMNQNRELFLIQYNETLAENQI